MIPRQHPDRCALVGMVHLLPLPGSPGWQRDLAAVRQRALTDASRLVEGGCDALIVENMGDVPYLKSSVHPETTAAMAVITADVVRQVDVPVGVQVLAAANREALGVAVAAGASFIRVEGFAYAHVADEGWIDASAGPLLRARAALGGAVAIWSDIQKKHAAHAVTGDLSLAELAHVAVFCGADAVIVTGSRTGGTTRPEDVALARGCGAPVVVGSGVTLQDCARLAEVADAVIVGSWLKRDGDWRAPVDADRVRALRQRLAAG